MWIFPEKIHSAVVVLAGTVSENAGAGCAEDCKWIGPRQIRHNREELRCGLLDLRPHAGDFFRVAGEQGSVESDEAEDLPHVQRWVGDGKAATRLAGIAVKRDERGEAGGIDTLDGLEVERDIVADHQGLNARKELLFVVAHELSELREGDGRGNGA